MLIILPTRGRPQGLQKTLAACVEMGMSGTMVIRVDEDDRCLEEYRSIPLPPNCSMVEGPRTGYGGAMRELFAAHPWHDCYGMMGDDGIPLTKNWDEKLRLAANRVNVAFPNDLIYHGKLGTHCFTGGDFLRALGWWTPPGMTHFFTDSILNDLGKMYGNLVYVPEVVIEHRHWSVGKAEFDETYEKRSANTDKKAYDAWRESYVPEPDVMAVVHERLAA